MSAATTPVELLALIDAYAVAAARRAASVECASWAFLDAHRAMVAARTAVADALGTTAPSLDDRLSQLAADADERERAWHARIDAVLAGASL